MKPDLTPDKVANWNYMTGKWYGEQPTQEGGIRQELINRNINGTYKVTFRVHDKNGKYTDQSEAGHWGMSGPIYFTAFRGWVYGEQLSPSNPSDPYNYDAYKIIKLNEKYFEYQSFSTSNRFSLMKVANDFEFPEL